MKDKIRKHLEEDYTLPIRDPLWKHIYLCNGMKKIISTKDFLRLSDIKQLGPAALVYPGATHTRRNHSLGVFYLAYKIIQSLIKHDGCPPITLKGVKAFLCAALLHDLGHFPYAHSFKELPLKDHETLSAEILMNGEISNIIAGDVGTDPLFTSLIIDSKAETSTLKDRGDDGLTERELVFYRNLLSGVLDPDKLDYLTRDAYFCGVPYGIQDTDFFLDQIIPIDTGIAIPYKGITAIENVLFSKYLMFKTVYWHRGVRSATALVKKAVFLALKKGLISQQELYGMNDNSFTAKMKTLDYPVNRMIEDSEQPYSYKILHSWSFDSGNIKHRDIKDLESRLNMESSICSLLNKFGYRVEEHEVILDRTGKISFEVELPVLIRGSFVPFPETGTVFSREVVNGFNRGLNRVQLILPADVRDEILSSSNFEEIIEAFGI